MKNRLGSQNDLCYKYAYGDHIIVGLVPQIRNFLIGDAAPLRVFQDTALLMGDGAIPAVTLIMGGNLLKGLEGSGIEKSVIFGIIVVRYVAMPMIGIVAVQGAVQFGLVHDDIMHQLLQFALPPAMNIDTSNLEAFSFSFSLWCITEVNTSLRPQAHPNNTLTARRLFLLTKFYGYDAKNNLG